MVDAHAAGIIHRDIKPGNILIASTGRNAGLVKITDFGISHAKDDVSLTQTGIVTGTPAYFAPEVARGQLPSEASDVYSLGATIYTITRRACRRSASARTRSPCCTRWPAPRSIRSPKPVRSNRSCVNSWNRHRPAGPRWHRHATSSQPSPPRPRTPAGSDPHRRAHQKGWGAADLDAEAAAAGSGQASPTRNPSGTQPGTADTAPSGTRPLPSTAQSTHAAYAPTMSSDRLRFPTHGHTGMPNRIWPARSPNPAPSNRVRPPPWRCRCSLSSSSWRVWRSF